MTNRFEQIVAALPVESYADPIAPWKVDVLDKQVRLTHYRVMQSGPDKPRIFHSLTQVFTIEQATELVNAIEQALVHLDPTPSPGDLS